MEGSYFAFLYSSDSTETEGCDPVLTLFQVREGALEEILNPIEVHPGRHAVGERDNERVFQFLKNKEVTEVYSVNGNRVRTLMGRKLSVEAHDLWEDYDGVANEHYWQGRFERNGIKVKLYEST
jgi:hypothetical protein